MKNKRLKGIVNILLVFVFMFSFSSDVFAVTNDKFTEANMQTEDWSNWKEQWSKIYNDYTELSLSPGANESELNFCWYIKDSKTVDAKVMIQDKESMDGDSFTNSAKVFYGESKSSFDGYKTNKVTVKGLVENTKYMYSYWNGSDWSKPCEYTTKSKDNFKAVFVGDPQIGASCNNISSTDKKELGNYRAARNDGYVFNDLLNNIIAKNPDVSFIISAGDQVNETSESPDKTDSEMEYTALLHCSALKSLPMAPTIGNHDKGNVGYRYHYNLPNNTNLGSTTAGGDYYYTYGPALFVVLNSNNTTMSEHEEIFKKAISDNNDYKWLIVQMHQDIFGAGQWHSQSDSKAIRADFAKLLEKYNVDLVLSGHDHSYARSYFISNTTSKDNYTVNKYNGNEVTNPSGILYITGNCSSGSKYYPVNSSVGSLNYIAKTSQSDNPTYSILDTDNNSLSITTYDATTNKVIDDKFTINKADSIKSSLGNNIALGQTTKLSINSINKDSNLSYSLEINGEKLLDNSKENSVDWCPDSVGKYVVNAEITDSNGNKSNISLNINVSESNKTVIYYKGYSTPYIHYKVGSGSWTKAPGVKMEQCSDIDGYTHKIEIDLGQAEILTACFNNGSGTWDNNNSKNYTFNAGCYTFSGGKITKVEKPSLTLSLSSDCSGKVLIGTPMTLSAKASNNNGDVLYRFSYINKTTGAKTVVSDYSSDSKYMFNIPEKGEYSLMAEAKDIDNEVSKTIDINVCDKIESNKAVIYYKGYSTPYIHYKIGSGSWTKAPGVKMEKTSELTGFTHKIEIDLGDAETLTACFNDGNGKWDNNNRNNYSFGIGTYTIKSGTISKIS